MRLCNFSGTNSNDQVEIAMKASSMIRGCQPHTSDVSVVIQQQKQIESIQSDYYQTICQACWYRDGVGNFQTVNFYPKPSNQHSTE